MPRLPRIVPAVGLAAALLPAQAILPPPSAPAGNPGSAAQVLLGQALFWDEQLSSSRTVACGTCHRFAHGGADPRAATAVHPGADLAYGTADDVHGSPGIVRQLATGAPQPSPLFQLQPQVTRRRAPSVVNAAYAHELFVDGRAGDRFVDPVTQAPLLPTGAALERQALAPLLDGGEMSHLGRNWNDLVTDLAACTPLALAGNVPTALQQFVQGQTYAALFQQVYGAPGVTPARLAFALAAYERTLVSDQSPFDRFLAGQGTLSVVEWNGFNLFQGLCANCHTDLLPSVLQGGPVLDDYRNIGVRPPAEDLGRGAVTGLTADRGRFRVPGLRNVALRAPYFHDGSAADLGAVIDFYARGGDHHDNQDPLLQPIAGHVNILDRFALLALLQSLTDPRVAQELPPFDRPRLGSEGAFALDRRGLGLGATAWLPPRGALPTLPQLGSARFAFAVDRVPAGAAALLLLDTAAAAVPVGLAGHELWLGSGGAVALPAGTQADPAGGFAWLALPVPAQAALAGIGVYGQWFVLDAAAPAGFASSDAVGGIVAR